MIVIGKLINAFEIRHMVKDSNTYTFCPYKHHYLVNKEK
jgi:hypothetical protein